MKDKVEHALEAYVFEWTKSGKRKPLSSFSLDEEGKSKLNMLIQEFHHLDHTLSDRGDPFSGNDPEEHQFPNGFESIEFLGSGAFGSVFRARDTQLDRMVAIKFLRSLTANQEEHILREGKTLASLKCDGIPTIYSIFPEEAAIVTEYIEGFDLGHFNQGDRRHELEIRQIIRIMLNLTGIVEKAHGKGIIHGDIKPGNVRVDASQKPYLLDFGLAQAMGETHHGWGTPGYSAPEQYQKGSFVNQRTDIFAIGALFYELVSGCKAYDSPETAGLNPPDLPRNHRPDCPSSFQAVLLKCIEPDPANRYSSVSELIRDLENALDGREVSARPTCFRTTLIRNVKKHINDLEDWERQGLIFPHEKQDLEKQYANLQKPLDDWLPGNRLLTLDQIILYLGVIVLLFGSGYLFYAHHFMSITSGWLYPTGFLGISFCVLIFATHQLKAAKTVAIAYDVAALNILPLLLLTLFSELDWFQYKGPDDYRLFSLFSNLQIQITFVIVFIWNTFRFKQNKTLAMSNLGIMIFSILYCCLLLGFGLKPWIIDSDFHRLAAHLIPLFLVLTYSGVLSEHQNEILIAKPCFTVAAGLMVVILELFALNGKTMELLNISVRMPLDVPEGFDPIFFNTILGCTLNGILIYLIARKLAVTKSPLLRQQGSWLLLITPFLLLEPLSWLVFSDTYGVFYHWFYLLISLIILLLSRVLQRKSFYFAGMLNTVVAIHMITNHYDWLEQTFWPITLLGVGGVLLVSGYRLFMKQQISP